VDGSEPDLAAGDFGAWVTGMRDAIRRGAAAEVPCGSCTACCTSAQFVHIAPDETATLARVPAALRFPAPGLPRGHVVLGYDERGHCPMLVAGRCSIYDDRPRACRTYDCRVFPAAGIAADEGDPRKAAIAARSARWRFSHPGSDDRARHDAVRAAAVYLRAHPDLLPGLAANPAQLASAAAEVHEVFRGGAPDPGAVAVELNRTSPEKSRNSSQGPRPMGR
jgi:uncharacterized protein